MTTEVISIKDKTKEAVYHNWQTNDIITINLDTLPKKGTLWGVIINSTYAELINTSLISRVARNWQLIDKIWEKPFDVLSLSSITSTTLEKCFLLFTSEVLEFCSKHNILSECYKYHKTFVETFKNIKNITVFISEDYEISNYRKVSFILAISDSIENVLNYEDEFRKKLRKEIPIEKRQYFVYNYNLI
jgi:hypothetical protein